jgi:hypothetical protein
MKNTTILTIIALLFMPFLAVSQDKQPVSVDTLANQVNTLKKDLGVLKRIKVSGYVQAQFQIADSAGISSAAGGPFAPGVDKRFMVRRGRLKVAYTTPVNEKGISTSQYVLQLDASERGFALKEAYAKVTDPWSGWTSLYVGMFDDPFGFEVPYSSSLMESPERGRMSQLHFPNEGEVGAMIAVQGPKNSKWNWLKWQAGFFNGNGSPSSGGDVSDFDKKKDFVTRLSMERTAKSEKIKYGVGVSYYDGGYRIDSVSTYKYGTDINGTKGFILDSRATENGSVSISSRNFTNRQYFGGDAQVSLNWKAGTTTLRGEFITGTQPANSTSSKSPNDKTAISKDAYTRNFQGAYVYFIQNIMKSPFSAVVKYDFYDPNTDVKGDDIGQSVAGTAKATNATDLRYDTWGIGAIYNIDSNVKITAYYDLVKNEASKNLSGYTQDLTDNVLTLRVQVKF